MSHSALCRGFEVLLGKQPVFPKNISKMAGDKDDETVNEILGVTAGSLVGGVVTGIFFAKSLSPKHGLVAGALCLPAWAITNTSTWTTEAGTPTAKMTFSDEVLLALSGLFLGGAIGSFGTAGIKELVQRKAK